MPTFKQVSPAQKGLVPPEVVEQYQPYIQNLERSNVGVLEFGENEDIKLGRKALIQAAMELRRPIRVRRKRGSMALQFQFVGRQRRHVESEPESEPEVAPAPKRRRKKHVAAK